MDEEASSLIAKARQSRRDGHLDDAFREYGQAAELSRASGPEEQLIAALTGLGQISRDRKHLQLALQHYSEALALCRRHSTPIRTAHTARHLGDIYRESGMLIEAEPLLQEALAIYRRSSGIEPLELANAIRPLALLKATLGDAPAARQLWQEALELYTAANVLAGVNECLAHLTEK
jgi:tetratricopeptide (TPR) repeat protein